MNCEQEFQTFKCSHMPVYMCAVSGGRRDSPAAAVGRGGPGGGGQGLLMGRGLPPLRQRGALLPCGTGSGGATRPV